MLAETHMMDADASNDKHVDSFSRQGLARDFKSAAAALEQLSASAVSIAHLQDQKTQASQMLEFQETIGGATNKDENLFFTMPPPRAPDVVDGPVQPKQNEETAEGGILSLSKSNSEKITSLEAVLNGVIEDIQSAEAIGRSTAGEMSALKVDLNSKALKLEANSTATEEKQSALEAEIKELRGLLDRNNKRYDALTKRNDELSQTMKTQHSDFETQLLEQVSRADKLSLQLDELAGRLDEHDGKFDKIYKSFEAQTNVSQAQKVEISKLGRKIEESSASCVTKLNKEVTLLLKSIEEKCNQVRQNIGEKLDTTNGRCVAVAQDVVNIKLDLKEEIARVVDERNQVASGIYQLLKEETATANKIFETQLLRTVATIKEIKSHIDQSIKELRNRLLAGDRERAHLTRNIEKQRALSEQIDEQLTQANLSQAAANRQSWEAVRLATSSAEVVRDVEREQAKLSGLFSSHREATFTAIRRLADTWSSSELREKALQNKGTVTTTEKML